MKKLFCIFIIAFVGCKQDAQMNDNTNDNKDTEENLENIEEVTNIKEVTKGLIRIESMDQVMKRKDKKSDTLYVTNFWATWCSPCVMEIPHFIKLQNELKDQKIKFFFINLEDIDISSFVQKYQMKDVYQLTDLRINTSLKKITSIPVTILEKKDMKSVIIGSMTEETISDTLNKYLNNKNS